MNEELSPDLSGKLVLVFLPATSPEGPETFLLEYCEWRQVGGRQFLWGRCADLPETNWAPGKETGIAWDSAVAVLLFRSREEYLETVRTAHASERKGVRKWLAG